MVKIESKQELKELVRPVLKYRKDILNKENIMLDEDEIFDYFVNTKWKTSSNLHLCDIVDDLINLKIDERCIVDETV